jgi:NitT/TauT family transport system substrate-binding protein
VGSAGVQLGVDLLEKKDLARHFGKSYVFESVRFQGTPPMITAIANNELEDLQPRLLDAGHRDPERRHGRHPRHRRRIPGRRAGLLHQEYMVLADGPIKKPKTSRARWSPPTRGGSAVDVAMRRMLRKFGLEDKRDYTVVEAPFRPCAPCWPRRRST